RTPCPARLGPESLLEDFDAVDAGVAHHGGELERDLAVAVGHGRELFRQGFEGAAGRLEDVQIPEDLRAVAGNIKDALAGCGRRVFGEVQPDGVLGAWRQVRCHVGEVAVAPALVDCLGGRIRDTAGVDSLGGRVDGPAAETSVSAEGTGRPAAHVN